MGLNKNSGDGSSWDGFVRFPQDYTGDPTICFRPTPIILSGVWRLELDDQDADENLASAIVINHCTHLVLDSVLKGQSTQLWRTEGYESMKCARLLSER